VNPPNAVEPDPIDSTAAWLRLAVSGLLATIGGVGMWSYMVALPAIQADFGTSRAAATLPFTFAMIGFAGGGLLMGRLADRFGIAVPLTLGTLALCFGYLGVGYSVSLTQVALAHGLLIGIGCSASFGPLIADISHWFMRRRGIAVAIAAAGNYLAGFIWPPLVQHLIASVGWRATHIGIGVFLLFSMLPLISPLRQHIEHHTQAAAGVEAAPRQAAVPFSPLTLQVLMCIAGVACCVAMSMPQVHIVAYCSDLGYGVARGAEMLSLMLGFGIVSRVASGFIADRIGGLRTLLLGSLLQGVALILYLMFDGLSVLDKAAIQLAIWSVEYPGFQTLGVDAGTLSDEAIDLALVTGSPFAVDVNLLHDAPIQPNQALAFAVPTEVPLPGAMWLLGTGLAGLIALGRRKRAAKC